MNDNIKKFNAKFGDVTTISGNTNEIRYNMNTFDQLEYDCWNLIKKYAEHFGLEIKHVNNDKDDIDFSLAKELQETVLQLFEDAGIEFIDLEQEKEEPAFVSLDDKINNANQREQQQAQKEDKHLIWGDIDLNFADWVDDLRAEYPDLTEDGLYEKMCEINADYLDDERANLDIQLNQPIIAIADIGRWDGRYSGYGMIESGNIKDCLESGMDYKEWFVDKEGDLRFKGIHHDGTNYYLYRVLKDNITDEEIEDFQDKIIEGKATKADIEKYTDRLGDEIGKVYGWEFSKDKSEPEQTR